MARHIYAGSAEIDGLRRALTQLELDLMPEGQHHQHEGHRLLAHMSQIHQYAGNLQDLVECLAGA